VKKYQAFLRYSNFRVGTFILRHCIVFAGVNGVL